ncbi:MAG: hypothetical protein WB992_26455 [Bryobacteraceae bacterium]
MSRTFRVPNDYLADDQVGCILNFATNLVGDRSAIRSMSYHILGIEDLAKKEEAAAMLRSLEAQHWAAVAGHRELAGTNNLLVAIILHIDAVALRVHDYWIAMRSPFEYLESASLIGAGEIQRSPDIAMSPLPMEPVAGNKD